MTFSRKLIVIGNVMLAIAILMFLSGCGEGRTDSSYCLEPSFEGEPDDAPIAFELQSTGLEGKTYFWPIILSEEKYLCYLVMDEDSVIVQRGELKITGSVEKTIQGADMTFLSTDLNISMERGSTLFLSRPGKRTATKKVID